MRRRPDMMKFHSSDSSSRRGSALLIVLGMLSFMIVSAVAFSVYMRMSRAPSSFLRPVLLTSVSPLLFEYGQKMRLTQASS